MINKKRANLLIFSLLLLFNSCRKEVIQDFYEFNPLPTINAFLVNGDTLQVNVSLAEKLDSIQLGFVNNAVVDLYVNDQFSEELEYVSNGVYKSTTIIEPLLKYTCKVHVPGYEIVECSQIVPSVPVIQKIDHINVAGKDEEGTSYPAIKISFENKIDEKAFYEIEIRIIRIFPDEVDTKIARTHTIIDPVILNEGLPIALFSNELIADSNYTLTLNYTTDAARSNGGAFRTVLYPFVIELRHVTEDYYRFKKQLYLYEEGRYADGILNSMTNTNIYTNISNGYGIFAAYSSTVSDTIIPNTDGYYY
jgi:hypothetical protein